jgi:hypothetical protein
VLYLFMFCDFGRYPLSYMYMDADIISGVFLQMLAPEDERQRSLGSRLNRSQLNRSLQSRGLDIGIDEITLLLD